MSGVLIAASIRLGTDAALPKVCVSRVRRAYVANAECAWTLLDFTCPAERSEALAASLADILRDEGGWYSDFGNPPSSPPAAELNYR